MTRASQRQRSLVRAWSAATPPAARPASGAVQTCAKSNFLCADLPNETDTHEPSAGSADTPSTMTEAQGFGVRDRPLRNSRHARVSRCLTLPREPSFTNGVSAQSGSRRDDRAVLSERRTTVRTHPTEVWPFSFGTEGAPLHRVEQRLIASATSCAAVRHRTQNLVAPLELTTASLRSIAAGSLTDLPPAPVSSFDLQPGHMHVHSRRSVNPPRGRQEKQG